MDQPLEHTAPVVDLDLARARRARARAHVEAKLPVRGQGEIFLGGPIPFSWWAAASRLPGRALHVALALWHQATLQRGVAVVTLKASLCRKLGVERNAMYRAVDHLQQAGLIEVVERAKGRCMTVRVCDAPTAREGADDEQ